MAKPPVIWIEIIRWCRIALDTDQKRGLSDIKATARLMPQIAVPTRRPVMDRERIQITQHSSLGAAWFAGWLFSIGYLQLGFWNGVLGIVVWPYFLGAHFVGAVG
jgi:hypothetical protein